MTLTIDVTQADIDAALRTPLNEPIHCCCPVAQALKRLFPTEYVSVGRFGIRLGNHRYYAYEPNGDIMNAITSLDRNLWHQAQPVSFAVIQESKP